jgi:hypothetical protein
MRKVNCRKSVEEPRFEAIKRRRLGGLERCAFG